MNIIDVIQQKLDSVLLKDGIMSHHLRRIIVDKINANGDEIKVNNDEYVVFRIIGNNNSHGDGKPILTKQNIDINYYYSYNKGDKIIDGVCERIKAIKDYFLSDQHFTLVSDDNDIYDIDNQYRGKNMELCCVGVF